MKFAVNKVLEFSIGWSYWLSRLTMCHTDRLYNNINHAYSIDMSI